jgi:DNA-binding NtrC family response regulator
MPDVLLIEDEAAIRSLMTMVLEQEGLTVETASDGQSGIVAFRRNPARVVVTDLNLPKVGGLEVLQTLRREYPAVPVILISGGGYSETQAPLALASHPGAITTLHKPFLMDELVEVVRAATSDPES